MTNEHQTLNQYHLHILRNINDFLEKEGLRKERLAKRMKKSPSTFYAHLKGKYEKSIYQFASDLATVLGYKPTFFIDENFQLPPRYETQMGLGKNVCFSAGKELSKEGKKGLEQIGKICDLIEIYFPKK